MSPLPPGWTRPKVQPEPPRTADDVLADLLALVAVVEQKPPAWRFLTTKRIRQVIEDGAA